MIGQFSSSGESEMFVGSAMLWKREELEITKITELVRGMMIWKFAELLSKTVILVCFVGYKRSIGMLFLLILRNTVQYLYIRERLGGICIRFVNSTSLVFVLHSSIEFSSIFVAN